MKMTNSSYLKRFNNIVSDLTDLAWPNLCLLCERPLIQGEKHLCTNCIYEMPKTDFKSFQNNLAADRFFGKVPFKKATAGYLYQKDSKVQQALELLKYKGEKELGDQLAGHIGSKLLANDFFQDIDLIVPVPLHKDKLNKRGYNQSEWIAKGLSRVTNIPCDFENLRRSKENSTQTTKSIWDRWINTQGLFSIGNSGAFSNKHLLLVDDVLTSGSTLTACGNVIVDNTSASISFFALALA